ncbi:putative peptide transporter [Austwickia chelonae NBRC 105200]|uniref:Putative peptide transporter n=1 Tax=Austwickia chelonae NBRC 105200 TaxID=1184607 RepID=K6WAZ7_9MICO|nr:putative peptide transporter [Austwickia chelonae NBRC 105200]
MAPASSEAAQPHVTSLEDKAFFGHPAGLSTLFFVEMWERFSYYGMRAILAYYLYFAVTEGGLGIEKNTALAVVTIYGASVYLLGVVGGFLADRVMGAWRATLYGGVVIMFGHISLAVPTATMSWVGIVLVAIGTGLLKPISPPWLVSSTIVAIRAATPDSPSSTCRSTSALWPPHSLSGPFGRSGASTPVSPSPRSAWPSPS